MNLITSDFVIQNMKILLAVLIGVSALSLGTAYGVLDEIDCGLNFDCVLVKVFEIQLIQHNALLQQQNSYIVNNNQVVFDSLAKSTSTWYQGYNERFIEESRWIDTSSKTGERCFNYDILLQTRILTPFDC